MTNIAPIPEEINPQAIPFLEGPPRSLYHVIDEIDQKLDNIETLIKAALFYVADTKCQHTKSKIIEFLADALDEHLLIERCSVELSAINLRAAA